MNTELLILLEIALTFTALLLVNKFLGKEGLIAWVALASVLANILTVKSTFLSLGWAYTEGSILFASTFLATDFLSERYGKKTASKAVTIGVIANIMLIVFTQFSLLYGSTPWTEGVAASFKDVFTISLRVTISSVVMYYLANQADVLLYNFLKEKTNSKHMWLRNNVSTILCNCIENFFFMFGAFLGVEGYSVGNILEMILTTSAVEAIIGLLDTPFLYLGMRWIRNDRSSIMEESNEVVMG